MACCADDRLEHPYTLMPATRPAPAEQPVIQFADATAFESWLIEHQADAAGIWLRLAKKGCNTPTVSYAEAVEIALCHGWIDGHKKPDNAEFWLQKFTRRAPRSPWSKINRDKATALIDNGRMQPAGLAEVERARQDGRWDAAYDSPSKATVPADFQAALDANDAAKAFFTTLDGANRYAMLYRIQTVKKAETRARKIAQFVAMLENHEKIHP
ncbi:YdeI/OmpD-associated family protein [Chitinimonas naiadis]